MALHMGLVVAVHRSATHGFSKSTVASITLRAGFGVEGDAHAGVTVQHRSRVARDPSQPNLRQVHLLTQETIDVLRSQGFTVDPGSIGENITTSGVDLRSLPRDAQLRFDGGAVVSLTGLRNPCTQLDDHQQGLQGALLGRSADGALVRLAGVMAVVVEGGEVRPGAAFEVVVPSGPQEPMVPV